MLVWALICCTTRVIKVGPNSTGRHDRSWNQMNFMQTKPTKGCAHVLYTAAGCGPEVSTYTTMLLVLVASGGPAPL